MKKKVSALLLALALLLSCSACGEYDGPQEEESNVVYAFGGRGIGRDLRK